MLVLARKVHEEIVIESPDGTRIVITPTRIDREKVRIGIDAPDDWSINRGEIQALIDQKRMPS